MANTVAGFAVISKRPIENLVRKEVSHWAVTLPGALSCLGHREDYTRFPMMVSNRNLLFQGVIFRCHVSFREGISLKSRLPFFHAIRSVKYL